MASVTEHMSLHSDAVDQTPMRDSVEGEAGMTGASLEAEAVDGVSPESLQRRIGEMTEALARYTRLSEDDGAQLKTTACMKSWYDLEGVIKVTTEYVREGVVRQGPTLQESMKEAKTLLEEVYDASMACHESAFAAKVAQTDLDKYRAHLKLHEAVQELDGILTTVPHRFKAARRDLVTSQTTLHDFSAAWKDDLQQRLSHRPTWIPDTFTRQCSDCRKPFSLVRSRHHCRVCGRIFCDRCTIILSSVPQLVYFTAQRVCRGCEKFHSSLATRHQQQLQHFLSSIFPDLLYH